MEKASKDEEIEIISQRRKKNLCDKVKMLNNKTDYKNIYYKILKDTNKFTKNSSGIYINMKHLSDDTILEIDKYVDECLLRKSEIENNIESNILMNNYNIEENTGNADYFSNYDNYVVNDCKNITNLTQ
jgi:hypothetical protein